MALSFAALAGCTQLAEGPGATRAGFPSLYTVPERPPPGPTAAETQAMIAELQQTQASPEAAIPQQPARPAERRASTNPVQAAAPPAPAPSASLRTWVATVVLAADGRLGEEDRARIAGLAGPQARTAARLLLEPAGVPAEDPGVAAVKAALVESGWSAARVRTLKPVAAGSVGPKVDIFVEY
jgi:hypothetical protein